MKHYSWSHDGAVWLSKMFENRIIFVTWIPEINITFFIKSEYIFIAKLEKISSRRLNTLNKTNVARKKWIQFTRVECI